MAKSGSVWKQLRAFALTLPEAYEDFPWGDRVIKVNKKIFLFLGEGDTPGAKLGFKLIESHGAALAVPDAAPMGYGLGKAGWVVLPLRGSGLPPAVLQEWIVESYCLVAPKKLAGKRCHSLISSVRSLPGRSKRSASQPSQKSAERARLVC